MEKYRKILAVSCLLVSLPMANAFAQGSVTSDGRAIPMIESSATVSGAYQGRASASEAAARPTPPAEVSRMLALEGVTGPRGAAESIIGADQRIRVNPTTVYPFRAVVLITFSAGRCSGWLIGPNTVATAGHCVARGGSRTFYPRTSYRIYPGYNGSLGAPYGFCTARFLATNTTWFNSGFDDYDYGAIKLQGCTHDSAVFGTGNIGNVVGWFGYFWTTGNSLLDFVSFNSGYPGDKPLEQWRTTDFIRVSQIRRLFYQNDTVGGNSGSPIYTWWRTCFPCGAAIHAYGVYNGPPFSTNNHGTRITQSVFNLLTAWRNS
jgi:glutamyl endopeptidase